MSLDDDVRDALSMDEPTIAQRLLDEAYARAKRAKARDAISALARRRAILAEEESVDDDLPSLARTTKIIAEAARLPDATPDDHARLGWARLMEGALTQASAAARGDPLTLAGIAWARKPSPERRAAMVDAAGPHLERVVRFLVQRSEPSLELARRLHAAREREAPLPARATLRALRLLVAAAHAESAPDAARLSALDPRHRDDALDARLERLARVEARFGGGAVLQPLVALAHAASAAHDFEVAVAAGERIDGLYALETGRAAREDRRYQLGLLCDACIALGRFDDALGAVERIEELLRRDGHPAPDHLARAKIAERRGDWDRCIAEHQAAIAVYAAHDGPGHGPAGSNTQLARGWLEQAMARRDRARRT